MTALNYKFKISGGHRPPLQLLDPVAEPDRNDGVILQHLVHHVIRFNSVVDLVLLRSNFVLDLRSRGDVLTDAIDAGATGEVEHGLRRGLEYKAALERDIETFSTSTQQVSDA